MLYNCLKKVVRKMPLHRCMCVYLFGSQHHRDHTFWLGGLGALVNEDGAELHLG